MAVPNDRRSGQRRMRIAFRQELACRRVACQNRIRSFFAAAGLPTPRGHRAWTEAGLLAISTHAKPLTECAVEELWRGMLRLALAEYHALLIQVAEVERQLDELARADPATQLLETIPGLGRRTAEVAAHIGDPGRFASAKQVGAFAGLVPRQYQSGVTDRRGASCVVVQRSYGSSWWSVPGACCGTTPGHGRCTSD